MGKKDNYVVVVDDTTECAVCLYVGSLPPNLPFPHPCTHVFVDSGTYSQVRELLGEEVKVVRGVPLRKVPKVVTYIIRGLRGEISDIEERIKELEILSPHS